ncbi:MAG: hypothetical protein ABFD70_06355 [Syntrophaceae bacterium]
MITRMYINPGDEAPFLSVSTASDDSQFSVFVMDVTPDQLRSLADDLAAAWAKRNLHLVRNCIEGLAS